MGRVAPLYDTAESLRAAGDDFDKEAVIRNIVRMTEVLGEYNYGADALRDLDDDQLIGLYDELEERYLNIGEDVAGLETSGAENIVIEDGQETWYDVDGNVIRSMDVDEQRIWVAIEAVINGDATDLDIEVLMQDGADMVFDHGQRQDLERRLQSDNPLLDLESDTTALELAHMVSTGEAATKLYNATFLAQTYGSWIDSTGKERSARTIAEWYEHESQTLFNQIRESGYFMDSDGNKHIMTLATLDRVQTDPNFFGNELDTEEEQAAVQAFRDQQVRLEDDMTQRMFTQDPMFAAMIENGLLQTAQFGGMQAKNGYFQKNPNSFAGIGGLHFGNLPLSQQSTLFSSWWDQAGQADIQQMVDTFSEGTIAAVSGQTNTDSYLGRGEPSINTLDRSAGIKWFVDDRGAPTQAGLTLMEQSMEENPMMLQSIGSEYMNSFDDKTYQSTVSWGDGETVGERRILVEGEAKRVATEQGFAPGNMGSNWDQIMQVAARYNVPWQILVSSMDMQRGASDYTDSIAVATSVAMEIQQGLITYGSMALAIWGLEDPVGASQMAQFGNANPASMAIGQQVVNQVLGGAGRMFYEDPWTTAEANFISGMSQQQQVATVRLTDPAEIREAMRQTYQTLLLPVPSEQEMAAQIAAIHAAESASQAPVFQSQSKWSDMDFEELRRYSLNPQQWYYPIVGASDYSNSYGYDGGRSARGYVHGGIDIYAAQGAAVVAPVAGVIQVAGQSGNAAGVRVQLLGDDGNVYVFSHMNSYNVRRNQRIEGGMQVGSVGRTGSASGTSAHLHFEMHSNGKYNRQSLNPNASGRTNPFPYLDATKASGNTLITGAWDIPSIYGAVTDYGIKSENKTVTRTLVNPLSRISEKMRGTPLYRQLYKNKPIGVTDVGYAQQFLNQAESLTGDVPTETARVGIESGSLETMFGHAFGSTSQQKKSSRFRDRLYRVSRAFNTARLNR